MFKVTRAAVITILRWGDQEFSQILQISSIEVNCKVTFKEIANQDYNFTANGQVKNRWNVDSVLLRQRLYIEGSSQPLVISWDFILHQSPNHHRFWRRECLNSKLTWPTSTLFDFSSWRNKLAWGSSHHLQCVSIIGGPLSIPMGWLLAEQVVSELGTFKLNYQGCASHH